MRFKLGNDTILNLFTDHFHYWCSNKPFTYTNWCILECLNTECSDFNDHFPVLHVVLEFRDNLSNVETER